MLHFSFPAAPSLFSCVRKRVKMGPLSFGMCNVFPVLFLPFCKNIGGITSPSTTSAVVDANPPLLLFPPPLHTRLEITDKIAIPSSSFFLFFSLPSFTSKGNEGMVWVFPFSLFGIPPPLRGSFRDLYLFFPSPRA